MRYKLWCGSSLEDSQLQDFIWLTFYVGFGGSNAAVILEEAPSSTRPSNAITNGGKITNGFGHVNGNGHTNGVSNGVSNGTIATNGSAVTNGNGAAHDTVKRVFVLSAKSESSLASYVTAFSEYLDAAPDSTAFIGDLSFTLGQRRTHYPYRVAASADSVESLKTQLSAAKIRKSKDRVIAFAFTGQGAQ